MDSLVTAPVEASNLDAAVAAGTRPSVTRPDYGGGSIVNLMRSLLAAFGGCSSEYYPGVPGLDPQEIARHRNVVLMVIDGMGADFLRRNAPGGEMHSRLLRSLTSVFPSTTAAAITTFLTGDAPQQHGLTGWFVYLRELADVFAVLPARPRCGGATFSRRGIDPQRVFDSTPVFDRITRRSIVVTPRRIAHSDYNLSHLGPAELRPYDSLDEFFLTVAMAIRERDSRPKFIYAYWPDLDSLGHEYGIDSGECVSHLAQIDERFGRLCRRLAGSGTCVLLTADHGLVDSDDSRSIELSDHPRLAETLLLPLCGERRAAYCYVKQHRTADFEAYVRAELSHCADMLPSENLIDQGYFGWGERHARLAERVGDYALLMKDNYVLKDWLPGESRYQHIGVHGGLSPAEMYVPLIAATL